MATGKDPQNLANLGCLNIGCHPNTRIHRCHLSGQADFIHPTLTFQHVGCRNYQVYAADKLNLLSVVERQKIAVEPLGITQRELSTNLLG